LNELTIGQLAELTGVRPGTLRMWESRHGFPRAERLPSGHRRYATSEVERVLEVGRARHAGLSLAAAIERLDLDGDPEPATSIYAGLRRRRPDLHPYPVPKRLLVAVSHAIEDECSAHGARAVMVGSFQREAFYRQAEPRWREFSRSAELAVAMADFERPAAPAGGPLEVPIGGDHPLASEWAIVCDAPGFSACLAGRERQTAGERVFEVLWSVEPEVVRDAALIALELAKVRVPARLSRPPDSDRGAVARATSVTNRILAYVAAGD
jgi:DNA-binding transcriptional MerR regulator